MRLPLEADASGRTLSRLRRRLLEWYDANKRDLPWRYTRDPYAIWISEIMLQQTRVETVIPYYERFLQRFPDVEKLASADLDDLYDVWTGLGYYSRARNLRSAARVVVEDHGGQLPSDSATLQGLAGIGRYTAGALASIAFDRAEPVVDGNVARVLARRFGIREDVSRGPVREQLWRLAGALVHGERPGDLNQAMMELGATVCTPRTPRCPACPLERSCRAARSGDPEALPIKAKRTTPRRVEAVALWLERRGRVLAVRRLDDGLLGGLWELPGGAIESRRDADGPEAALRRHLASSLGLSIDRVERGGEVTHLFSHRRLRLHVFRCASGAGRVRRTGFADHRWLAPAALAKLPQGGPTRKALALLGQASGEPPRRRLRRGAGPAGP